MKLLRTIRLDPSDTFIFEPAAEPGEWAVSGAFVFWSGDPAALQGKARSAFRGGFLGVSSLGWSTLVQIVEASVSDRVELVDLLAQRLVERFGAPDLDAARTAAEEEVAFTASLCSEPQDTLIAVHRSYENGEVREILPHIEAAQWSEASAGLLVPGGGRRGGRAGCGRPGRPDRPGGTGAQMNDFWISCGHHLLDRDESGGLVVTDDFLKVYLARPELIPPPEACAVERTLHSALLAEPRMAVADADIAAIEDADARENWQLLIAFRDHLLRHKTLEAAYGELVRRGLGDTPPLFVNQLVHVILRNALDGVDDAQVVRAAELFFRPQRVTLHEDALIAADEETIGGANPSSTSPLVSMLGIPAQAEIDILNDDNADSYWQRSDQFDMAIDLTTGRSGLPALAEAIRRWIAHILGVETTIEPLEELRDVDLAWYVGLDADGTRIGDQLWNGEDMDKTTMSRVVGLFRLTIRDPSIILDKVKGEPVYLIMAMTPDKLIRMKPQNLVAGLPIRHLEAVS